MPERAITFDCDDDTLLGILHEPAGRSEDVGILIIVGGPQYRVGSHRQFVLMARSLAAAGYPVLRFDYRGMGDASGVQRSFEFVEDDVRAAIDVFLAEQPALRGVVIFGLCDAASAALLYCPSDARVHGLILANPWVRTEQGEAKAFVQHYYGHRLLQRSFWEKVLAGRVDAAASAGGLFRSVWKSFRQRSNRAQAGPARHFTQRMEAGLAAFPRPILVLLSDRDLTAREFAAFCGRSALWGELMARDNVEVSTIAGADHTFSSAEALEAAGNLSLQWLARRLRG